MISATSSLIRILIGQDALAGLLNIVSLKSPVKRSLLLSLGLNNGVDRATLKRLARIAPDKLAEAKERGRKRSRDALHGRINAMRKRGNDLLKTVKGLANIK